MAIGIRELIVLLLFGLAIYLYFLPFMIARRRNHPQKNPILIVNIFLGWTLIGWVAALAWSLWNYKSVQISNKD